MMKEMIEMMKEIIVLIVIMKMNKDDMKIKMKNKDFMMIKMKNKDALMIEMIETIQ